MFPRLITDKFRKGVLISLRENSAIPKGDLLFVEGETENLNRRLLAI